MRVLLSSGEASGDTYGAQLIHALQRRAGINPAKPAATNVIQIAGASAPPPAKSELELFGAGGDRMRTAGLDTIVHAKDVSVVGLAEVLTHLPKIYAQFKKLVKEIDRRRPDVAVLIDFPDWNFRLAKELHKRGIPVVYYVSPQLWAWRPQRIEQVKKYVRKMLVIFPFEEQWYRERGVDAEYVGHPLVGVPRPQPPHLRSPQTPIGLLPGSRQKEISMNLPTLLQAAKQLGRDYQFFLPVASTINSRWIIDTIHKVLGEAPGVNLKLENDARLVLAQSRAAMVASGTATIEATLIGTPFVMVYRVSPVTYKVGRGLVKVPFFAMPNLIAGREVVPELVQDKFTPENVAARMREIIPEGPARDQMLSAFAEIRQKLTFAGEGTAADRVADKVMEVARTSASA
ncbi:MAG: lipid-A-disaccharide synthase [Terriglobales bacterium]